VPVALCQAGEVDQARAHASEVLGHADFSPNYVRLLEHGDAEDVGDTMAAGDEAAITERLRRYRDAGVTDLAARVVPLGADAHALLGGRALPVLRGLAELTGESANLAVLTQGCAEYVAQAPGRHTMRTFTEVGNRVALHCTGVGKALLAAVPPAQASRLIGAAPLAALTAGTITDPAALHAEIALTRTRGYALDEGELETGVRCVAVGLPGTAPMAISVSGPAARMTDDLITAAVSALRTAADQLQHQLA